ncbi:hephaestin-like protein [Haliotis rufescens]|uniref:hephaestin-like protein n=1 Tax=Haliotis rufescens TaxID=6454 RepID=UPI00201EF0B2|nr:hephaestin-like protein [Haliotis rufescens]
MMVIITLVIVLALCGVSVCRDREYFLAAVEVDWDYAPTGTSVVKDEAESAKAFIEKGPDRVGSKYRKAVYSQYTDKTFTKEVSKPLWLGFIGPTLKGEVGDKLIVHFKNLATKPYSVHPHGVKYSKSNEGALYSDGTKDGDKMDDTVIPGGEHTYTWEITEEFGPTPGDKACIPWAYHSHSKDAGKDTNSGLLGTLLTCKKGALDEDGNRKDVDKEFVAVLKIFDENQSWYLDYNMNTCEDPACCVDLVKGKDDGFAESNRMHALNGYVFGNGPKFEACSGDKVVWYVIGMGSEDDVHSFMVDGESMTYEDHRVLSVDVFPSKFVSAEMVASHQGWKLVYCKANDHFDEGMQGFFNAKKCADKPEPLIEEGNVRKVFLMIHEHLWDYLPSGVDKLTEKALLDDSPESQYFIGKSTAIGSQYMKARFVQYEDKEFQKVKRKGVDDFHLGILGPIIRVEVGETLEVTLWNNATRPFSFYAQGLIQYGQAEKDDSVQSITTGGQDYRMYRFYVPETAAPTDKDTACVTFMYQSAVDPVKDINSGLLGPLLVCKRGSLDDEGKQKGVDKDRALFFGVFDENKSWYLDKNIEKFTIASKIDKKDPKFVESNRMRGVNGRAFGNLGGMELCRAEQISWHLFCVGDQTDVHSIYFHGMDFDVDGSVKDTVELVPGKSLSFVTLMSHIGNWGIFDRNTDHFKAGLSMLYEVKNCDYLHPALLSYTHLPNPPKRQYYIAAMETEWEYAPSKKSVVDDSELTDPKSKSYAFALNDNKHVGTKYRKAVFKEFRDSAFSVPKHKDAGDEYLGFLGPVVRAEVGDVVEIVFKNMASRTYSLHAHLVNTDKANEGSLYSDRTDTKTDDGVPPGGFHVYRWEITKGPGSKDPACISSMYYSAHNQVKDAYSGLIGPLIICRKGVLGKKRVRKDVDKEFILLFSIMDENQSWYLEWNQKKFATDQKNHEDAEFVESNKMHMINGFVYQSLPGLTMNKGDTVAWHILGFGGTQDIHTVHFHGQTLLQRSGGVHSTDVITVFPEVGVSAIMKATNPGKWFLHCHVNDHIDAGMDTTYTILDVEKTKEESK